MKKIRLTENKLKTIIRESIMQILTETYHALDKLVFNFADEVFEEIFTNKEEILSMLNQGLTQGSFDNIYFTKYLDFSSIYPKIKPVEFYIHVFYNNEDNAETRGGLGKNKQHIFLSANIFKKENIDVYRSSIIHELNHFIYTQFPYFNYISRNKTKELPLNEINQIEYMFNKSELTARNSQLSYYLHILNGKPINDEDVGKITNLDRMKKALTKILNDTYDSAKSCGKLSIIIGLNAIRNKTRKGNTSTITLNDYYDYKVKISEPMYNQLKKSTYNRMLKIYERFNVEIKWKIHQYKTEHRLK